MGKKDTKGFLKVADTVFAPIYPIIANQIVKKTGIRKGKALDVGCGPGHLGIALATESECTVHGLDISQDMIQTCIEKIKEKGLSGRVIPTQGDVCDIPFDDETFDLVISRGSWFFWEDLPCSLKEIYRVLKPGGTTYIGGGFGNSALKKQIVSKMKEKEPDFENAMKDRIKSRSPEVVSSALKEAGIQKYSIINDESGFWLMMERT
ncbi:MAG: class I SAM-dependent methyltransferase [Methanomicrobiales archaeon]|nr:class I SAM-dependent methyltransferase [Methanomicrobiales archaeon]